MPSDPDPADNEAATRLILESDTSKRGWTRRAVAMPRDQALDQIPKVGQLVTQIPIEPLRILQRHIQGHDVAQARWMRQAIVEKYLREGGDPEVGEAALTMRVDHRRHDVPHDHHGQPRNRQGRNSRKGRAGT